LIAACDGVGEYAPGESILPETPEMFSMRPALDFFKYGTTDFVVKTYDIRLQSIISRHVSAVKVASVPGIVPPTLLTRMSQPPSAATALSTKARQPSSVVRAQEDGERRG